MQTARSIVQSVSDKWERSWIAHIEVYGKVGAESQLVSIHVSTIAAKDV